MTPSGVRHLGDRHQLHRPAEQREIGVHVDLAVIEDRDRPDDEPLLLCKQMPWHDVRVVLEGRYQDLVTLVQIGASPARRYKVDALGAAAHEDDFPVVGSIDEMAHRRPRLLEAVGRRLREVSAPPDARWRIPPRRGGVPRRLPGAASGRWRRCRDRPAVCRECCAREWESRRADAPHRVPCSNWRRRRSSSRRPVPGDRMFAKHVAHGR